MRTNRIRKVACAALTVLLLLLATFLLSLASAASVSTDPLPDTTTVPGGTNSPAAPEPRVADPAPMPTVEEGGLSGGVWGILIAVAIAAFAVVLIFLFLPRADGEERKHRRS